MIDGIEILIIGVILIFLFNYLGTFSFNKFVLDNKTLFSKLKEDDYDFLLVSKYGERVNVEEKYQKRVKTAIITFVIALIVVITTVDGLNFALKLVIVFVITYLIFKND